MTDAHWLPIDGYEGYYEVSSNGAVRSLSRVTAYGRRLTGRVLKNMLNTHGYPSVNLCMDGKRQTKEVHRLVAKAFVVSVDGKPDVNHRNGIKVNCRAENLEWCTHQENSLHSRRVLLNKGRPCRPLVASRDGEELRFESWMDAGRKGFNTGSIHAVLHGNHGRKTHGGYTWRYA